jgi:hypothetical protein
MNGQDEHREDAPEGFVSDLLREGTITGEHGQEKSTPPGSPRSAAVPRRGGGPDEASGEGPDPTTDEDRAATPTGDAGDVPTGDPAGNTGGHRQD